MPQPTLLIVLNTEMKRQGSGEQPAQFLDTKKRRTEDDDGPDVDPDEDIDWDADEDNDMYLDAMDVCPYLASLYNSTDIYPLIAGWRCEAVDPRTIKEAMVSKASCCYRR